MYELGPAPWLLIVENTAAFTSLRDILGTWPDRSQVGWVGFGEGDHLIASLPTAQASFRERDHPVDTLLLYADLDLKGLCCAQKARERAHAVGLPRCSPPPASIRPSSPAHHAPTRPSPQTTPMLRPRGFHHTSQLPSHSCSPMAWSCATKPSRFPSSAPSSSPTRRCCPSSAT